MNIHSLLYNNNNNTAVFGVTILSDDLLIIVDGALEGFALPILLLLCIVELGLVEIGFFYFY